MFPSGAYTQDITYWASTGLDGYGTRAFSSPILLKGRWQGIATREISALNITGHNVKGTTELDMVDSKVYLTQELTAGDFVALGDYTATANPLTLANAHMIHKAQTVTSLLSSAQVLYMGNI